MNRLTESKVVCPHCWNSFYPDQALFISTHPQLYGDAVLGEHVHQRFSFAEVKRDRSGRVFDPKGGAITERACPVCHLQVPRTLLTERPYFLSVVGAPKAGKTYFLTSMIHCIRDTLTRHFNLALEDSDSHEVKVFLEYEKSLFHPADPSRLTLLQKTQEHGDLYNTVHLDGAVVELPKPFIFTLRQSTPMPGNAARDSQLPTSIVLYDNAGESFQVLKETEDNSRVTQHLKRSNAVLFAYDPLQDPTIRRELAGRSQDPQLEKAAVNNRQEHILKEAINRIRRHKSSLAMDDNQRIPAALCVCVQKYDVWKPLIAQAIRADGTYVRPRFDHEIPEEPVICSTVAGDIAGIDVEQINQMSLIVRNLLERTNPQFVALAESHFDTVRYFPVSALGTSPQYEPHAVPASSSPRTLKVRLDLVRPSGVTHPLLWLFHRWGLVHHAAPKFKGADHYPHAQVDFIEGDRIRVISPLSNKVFVLDNEYAGCTIEDPHSGQRIWIPAIQRVASRSASKNPPPVPPRPGAPSTASGTKVPESLKLGLDTPPKRRRFPWSRS